MKLLRFSSPHIHTKQNLLQVMWLVLIALLPGIIILIHFYSWGILSNIVFCCLFALCLEILVALLRKRPAGTFIQDGSVIITAILLAISAPPFLPLWACFIAMFFAVVIAKHLYGGLGYNPFNPAMIAYVIMLIAFPLQFTIWPLAYSINPVSPLSLWESFTIVTGMVEHTLYLPDGYSGATALDIFKHNSSLTAQQLYSSELIFKRATLTAVATEWVNIAFLCGGIFLIRCKLYTWHGPISMLTTLALCAAIGNDSGSSTSHGSVLFHLLNGSTMLAAFFIITDPVTNATSNLGRVIVGIGAGLLIYIIRIFGNYPDGAAFAVLLMNFCAPFIDYYTQPRTLGHAQQQQKKFFE